MIIIIIWNNQFNYIMNKALKRLLTEFKEISDDPNSLYSICPNEDNVLLWEFIVFGPPDTIYEGGIFEGFIEFPSNYPSNPPKVKFKNILHPNIYKNGEVCISILHEGSDVFGYEKDIERWLPSHGVNTIMISIISMLSAPNFESPANVDASILWKDNPELYKDKIYSLVTLSQK